MNEIIYAQCQKAHKVDEAGFADILKQVRGREFAHEMHKRMEMLERDKHSAVLI